jgi:cell division septation protein DedD
MIRLAYLLPGAWAVLALWGCGSSEEMREATPPPATPPVQSQPKLGFETRVDTVKTVSEGERAGTEESPREGQIRFMIQIGAFKDARNASRIQGIARERYHLPVLNDFHTRLGLYQIRIGFFETREQAMVFRQQMRTGFPSEYKDAWVVQLKR